MAGFRLLVETVWTVQCSVRDVNCKIIVTIKCVWPPPPLPPGTTGAGCNTWPVF